MRCTALFAILAATATHFVQADAPSGHEVEIESIAFAGSGCPAGSVSGQLSSDLTTLTLLFADYVAQAGSGVPPIDYRKNCQLNVKVRYPQGWQWSIFKADYRGYAYLPQGGDGTCKSTYYFSGSSQQMSSAVTLVGPYDNNYLKTDEFNDISLVWSPCGIESMLNINAEVLITPLNLTAAALMTVDSTDLSFHQVQYLQWSKC